MSEKCVPEAPADAEQCSVIDKLAEFVARNGPEFERMTMEKQQGNPQFDFLFGGEHSEYYKYKVDELRKNMAPHQPLQVAPHHPSFQAEAGSQPVWSAPYNRKWEERGEGWNGAPWPSHSSHANWSSNWGASGWPQGLYSMNHFPHQLPQQQQHPRFTEEDVRRSEENLKAQYNKIIGEDKPLAVRRCLDTARMDSLTGVAASLSINLEDVSSAIQPLIEICTKENIARGKSFAVEVMSKGEKYANFLAEYLLVRVQNSNASFDTRLHIVYLINDLLHYIKRHPEAVYFKTALNRIVVPVYSLALSMSSEDKRVKLTRVLNLWESNAYLSEDILKNVKEDSDRNAYMEQWLADQDKIHAEKVAEVEADHMNRYEALKKQHEEFAEHVRKTLEAAAAEADHSESLPSHPLPFADMPPYGPPPPRSYAGGWGGGYDAPPPWHGPPPPFMSGPPPMLGRGSDRWGQDVPPHYHPDNEYYDSRRGPPPPHVSYRDMHLRSRYRGRFEDNRDGRYGASGDDDRSCRDLHHRRRFEQGPGFSGGEGVRGNKEGAFDGRFAETPNSFGPVSEEDLIPKVPFWQLPAGLMHPLIKKKDFEFIPLDPSKLRLLAPKPPSEQLMAALDAYYEQPSHDRPREPDGWERLGLYEFYKAKEEAKNKMDSENSEANTDDEDEKSGSASPVDGSSKSKPSNAHLAYRMAYPKSAIGQAIRTGPAALIGVPPPNLILPKMNAQFAMAAAAAAAVNSSLGVGSGEQPGGFSKNPTTSLSMAQPTQHQHPPSSNQMIARARFSAAPPVSRRRSRSRSYSRFRSSSRSRSRSRSSRSRSRSYSRSRSKSHSCSSRSRSRSLSSERRYRDRSGSPRSNEGSITTAGYMRRGDNRNSRGSRIGGSSAYSHPQWNYDQPPPPGPMMPSHDRRPYGAPDCGPSGGGYLGNGFGGSPPQIRNANRGGGPHYYNGPAPSYGNSRFSGGGGGSYQGR